MKPTLQETLDYLRRTVNPNYIIILQNKAKEEMDFSQFKPVLSIKKEQYKPQKRYSISHKEYGQDEKGFNMVLVIVIDTFCSNKEVYRVTCKENYLEDNLKVAKGLYKGSSIEDKI